MGWKGTLRSMRAAARAAERDAKRRGRELERQRREADKLAELERAELEVAEYENYVERLVTIHQEVTSTIDWTALVSAPEPQRPQRRRSAENIAKAALESYRPSLIDRLFGRKTRKLAALNADVENAPAEDEAIYQSAVRSFEQQHKEWLEAKDFAQRILRRDTDALIEAIREMNPFSEISRLGSGLEFDTRDGRSVNVVLHVHSEEVVPKSSKSLLKSGRLTEKTLPKGRYYELYQDHVCSALLRVAREIFALLPVDAVVVTAKDQLLNPSTGHMEEQAILSVAMPRQTFEGLNLRLIDPSDSMANFLHRMSFKETKGFTPVEPIGSEENPLGQ